MQIATIIETRRIRFRKVQESDFPKLFIWRNSEKFRFLFHYNERIVTYEEFCTEFTQDATVREYQFVIVRKDTEELIGLTFTHSYSSNENSCIINTFLSEPFEKKGYGVESFVLFFVFLFQVVGINILYAEAFSYNTFSIACIRRSGMKQIGVLPTKKNHNGKEYEVLRFKGDVSLLPAFLKFKEKLCLSKN